MKENMLYLWESFADDDLGARKSMKELIELIKEHNRTMDKYNYETRAFSAVGAVSSLLYFDSMVIKAVGAAMFTLYGLYNEYNCRSKKVMETPSKDLYWDVNLTRDSLSKFPKEDRKYLLAMPPFENIDLETHLSRLKGYGFPVSEF